MQEGDKDRDMMEERREAPAGEAETAVSAADAGEEGPGEAEALREQLRACEERVLRLAAELDNFKKRVEREKAEHMRYALEAFAKELLPFLDNLERAVAAAKDSGETDEKLVEGLELALSGYLKTLERFGLKAYSCMGQRFDPNFHEALSVQECHDVEENTVVQELLKGYSLHERVIRPALVVVSKKPPEGSGQGEPSA